ncbi:hypothetical protein HanPI659440_Chr15g0610111 [Helianthus annuus]|nr:hypothetical protein HanPI659440_Chr15g0610111 [Helianthus annuus]
MLELFVLSAIFPVHAWRDQWLANKKAIAERNVYMLLKENNHFFQQFSMRDKLESCVGTCNIKPRCYGDEKKYTHANFQGSCSHSVFSVDTGQ